MTGVIIPLYIYPTDASWSNIVSVKKANPTVPIIAVINPNSGPGISQDINYVNGIASLRAAGVVVLGYVATNYGNTSTATVEDQINSYHSWYTINGIFFDEMSTATLTEAYYIGLNNYCMSIGYFINAGNPGTTEPTIMLGIFSVENLYESNSLPTTAIASGGAFIAYNVPSLPSLDQYSSASYIYITDKAGGDEPNAYEALPSYFAQEVAALAGIQNIQINIVVHGTVMLNGKQVATF